MWIQTIYGAFSIVAATTDGTASGDVDSVHLLVRARVRAHLHALQSQFPAIATVAVIESPARDYPFRMLVFRKAFGEVMKELAEAIPYPNFKDAAAHGPVGTDNAYIHALHQIWSVLRHIEQPRVVRGANPPHASGAPAAGKKRAKRIA